MGMLCTDLFLLLLAAQLGSAADLKAEVFMAGLRGDVIFSQTDLGGPIGVNFDLQGVAEGKTYDWDIHKFPVNYDVANRCSEDAIGERDYDEVRGSVIDTTQVGNVNIADPQANLTDLLGKSIRFVNTLEPLNSACATILPIDSLTTAVVRFQSVIGGTVVIRQPTDKKDAETVVFADLFYVNGSQVGGMYDWKIMSNSADESSPASDACKNLGNVFGASDICRNKSASGCGIGDLTGKLGQVSVGVEMSSTRMTWSDAILPLTGNNSINSKAVAILDNNGKVISCANIKIFKSRIVTVSFSSDGIEGDITFTQNSPFDPTHVNVDLHGLKQKAGGYHVHDFPVPQHIGADDNLCSGDSVSGHWNPFDWITSTSPPAGTGTSDQYEVGDLSGKYGLLTTMDDIDANFTDWNLPLFGKNSIVGRSVVIHKADVDGSRWVCANTRCTSMLRTAVVTFKYPVIGSIYFQQAADDPLADTSLYMDLNYGDGSSGTVDHNWHVHVDPAQDDFTAEIPNRCQSAAGHFNPFNVHLQGNYSTSCSPKNEIRCEIGDLAKKHGQLAIRSSKGLGMKYFFTDTTLPLSGPRSIIGRSVVIHVSDSGGQRLACANIHEVKMVFATVTEWSRGGVSGSVKFQQAPLCPYTMVNVDVKGLQGSASGYHVHIMPIVAGVANPCSGASVSGHFNPFMVNVSLSPPAASGTMDMYEVGDLSGKFGNLDGLEEYKGNFSDTNLPLFGLQSILGRSIVIHKKEKNARWVCGNIVQMPLPGVPIKTYRAKATFEGTIQGYVMLTQVYYHDGRLGDTQIYIDLKYADSSKKTLQHNWHIHENPIATEGDCASAGGHYNPYHVDVKNNYTECSGHNPLRCEVGDQSGKHEAYDIGGGPRFYTDVDIPLMNTFAVMSRSLVVHAENKGAPRIACADILPMVAEIVEMTVSNPRPFDKSDFMNTIAQLLQAPKWMISVKMGSDNVVSENCMNVKAYIIGPHAKDMKNRLNHYLENESGKLGKYSADPLCVASAADLCWSMVLLVSAFFLQRWLTL